MNNSSTKNSSPKKSSDLNTSLDLDSEKSDMVHDITKVVNNWLRDNNNNNNSYSSPAAKKTAGKNVTSYQLLNKKDATYKKRLQKLTSITISEDEDNYDVLNNSVHQMAVDTATGNNSMTKNVRQHQYQQDAVSEDSMNNKASNDEDNIEGSTKQTRLPTIGAASSSYETNDSAVDMRSYGSISIHSKASSNKSRINWQSFSKSYRYYFQSTETTWSKYQISAMSLEQIMSLRKLALIQFSKLVERQHSNMIR